MFRKDFKPFNSIVSEPEIQLETQPEAQPNAHRPITQMSVDDRPREKLMARGVQALTNAELLAILIGMGTTKRTAVELMQDVMEQCGGKLSELSKMTIESLQQFDGIGPAKALTIIAAAEIGRRRAMERVADIQVISTADEVHRFMQPYIQDMPNEASWVLLLNTSAKLIKCAQLSTGGLTETQVDVRMLMKEAVLCNATRFILVHNHPSGNPRPSRADGDLTDRVSRASRIMNITMIDHVIVCQDDYYSFAENGRL